VEEPGLALLRVEWRQHGVDLVAQGLGEREEGRIALRVGVNAIGGDAELATGVRVLAVAVEERGASRARAAKRSPTRRSTSRSRG
jgi:hypothetical protein